MARIHFSTKAQTLLALKGRLSRSTVLPLRCFTVETWRTESENVIRTIQDEFSSSPQIIVRSSCAAEDSASASHAGEFCSIGNVVTGDTKSVVDAIDSVIRSYGREESSDEFFVQPHLSDAVLSGVAFSRDGDSLAPYYVINYDDTTTSTSSVTAGTHQTKTYIRFRGTKEPAPQKRLDRIVGCLEELEALFECDRLDIEFAFTASDELILFQVRPIAARPTASSISENDFAQYLVRIRSKLEKLSRPHPYLFGDRGMYSVMTDWNPAEMIGLRPKALARSLYQQLITDDIWAYQRNNYGYKNVRSCPLLVDFLGLPYIDIRASFSSFVPQKVDNALAHKLVNYYMDQLTERPSDHDKVEFEIVHSCYDLNLATRIKKLLRHGFTELELDRLKYALLDLTNTVVSTTKGLYQEDLKKLDELTSRFDGIVASELSPIDKIYWLIEDGKRYGTLPFAGLARAGFIAVQMLRSLVDLKIFSDEDYQSFLGSLNTVAKRLANDTERVQVGTLSKEEFLQRYGHLRPGTYDILSLRYDEAPELYFQGLSCGVTESAECEFHLTSEQYGRVADALKENGLLASVDEFFQFIREAVEGREYGKFLFSRNVSQILSYLVELGEKHGMAREDLAFVDIETVRHLYTNLTHESLPEILRTDIQRNKQRYDVACAIRLPQLIQRDADALHFFLSEVEPNFITRRAIAETVVIEEDLFEIDLSQKIVFIRSADPGHDWIFSRKIGALVTMYGGVNSHMAIRCAELGIPAVIGCGEQNYAEWSRARHLQIDCANRKVRVLASNGPERS
ncbi:MAG: PEP-utilizing enzyme [Bdellovibrionota bacterium]